MSIDAWPWSVLDYIVSNYGESIKKERIDSLYRSLAVELFINIAESHSP